MPLPSDPAEAALVAEFLTRYEKDLAAGSPRDLAGYQALYPGHEALIAAEWARLETDAEPHPERIAHYAIERELGRGGQGRVYLARDEKLERHVALKVLPDRGPFSARQLARFRREAEVAARLDHPGICTVFDTGQADGVTYIAMRYVPGHTLAATIREKDAADDLADRDALFCTVHLIEKTARAVHAAHLRGIVHRDLKPSNIMVSEGGDPVVLDFGLARDETVGEAAAITLSDEIFGTPVYMSPEQLRGSKLDHRTDIYSLGATLYEALTLEMPFGFASRESLFQKILLEEPTPVGRLNRNLPRDLCTVVETAMAKERDRRYRTAEDFAEDLRRVREYLPIEASPVGPVTRALRWCQRNRTVAALTFVLFVVMGVALTLSLRSLKDSEEARRQLEDNLEDILAGKESKREKELQDLILRSWQKLHGADPQKALPLLDEIDRFDPGNTEAIAARTWLHSEDPVKALAVLDAQIARLEAVDPELSWLRARFLTILDRVDEARTERAKAGDDETPLRLYFMGLTNVKGFLANITEEEGREAIALFRRAIARSDRPRFHFLHSILMTAARIGDRALMDEAAADLEHHWPDSSATHDAIAQFYLPVDRERSLRALRWLTEHTKEAAPFCGLAADAMARGKPNEALDLFDRGIALEPEFAPIWWMRGGLHQQRGDVDQARADFLAAIDRAPDQPHFTASLWGLHAKAGAWQRARADFAAITARHAASWLGWNYLGRACDRLEDEAAALSAYEAAARLRPDDEHVMKRLDEIRKKQRYK